jgi:alkaline phosphatase D
MRDISRRELLGKAAALTPFLTGPCLWPLPAISQAFNPAPPPRVALEPREIFTLGVASGDPLPNGVVLWTRLAPDPLNGGGMLPVPVEVTWEVATDERFQNVVRKGVEIATPEWAHSLHVEVDGLEPARWYYYRFRTPKEESRVGLTRTAEAPGTMASRFRFALACCQDYQHGYYIGHRQMAQEELDAVVFVGDYIYEGEPQAGYVRMHNNQDTFTVEEFRNRHALYKMDPDLQASHALRPWIVTWDDHELDNDYANLKPSWDLDPQRFLGRRIASYRAYYEHMPLRKASIPNGKDLLLYRSVNFGNLVHFNVLDTRQYRDVQACQGAPGPLCTEHLDPNRSIMGFPQEEWLFGELKRNPSRWNIIAQQVPVSRRALRGERGSTDKWDGYVASRNRMFEALEKYQTSNPVILSGDIHQAWAGNFIVDFDRPDSKILGSEFITSSLSSGGDGQRDPAAREYLLSQLPYMKFANGRRGYVSFDMKPDIVNVAYRAADSVTRQDSAVRNAGTFIMEAGRPGLQKD